MKLKYLLFFFVATGAFAQTSEELLNRIDQQRSFPQMAFTLTVSSYEGEKNTGSNTLWGYVKTNSGANKTLLWFAEPTSVKGRKMLMDGATVYMLFPKTRNPIRLSPLQVLLGEASNGDVARSDFSQSYTISKFEKETWNQTDCFQFTLQVKPEASESTYKKIVLWVEVKTLRPLYAEFYGSNDKLWKKTTYRDYRIVEGKSLPFTIDIADASHNEKHTVMTYRKIGRIDIPDSMFRREYLEAWTPKELP